MNELQVFKNSDFGEIRVQTIHNEPWFCLVDVCKILDIKNSRDCKERLNQKGVVNTDTLTKGGTQSVTFINESNLYKVIFQSRKPEAEKFTEWVTSEVLPSIRQTGGYISNDDLFINTYLPFADSTTKSLFKATLQTVREQNEKIKELTPKAQSFDVFIDGSNLQTMNDVAKCLGIGRNKLFALLREKKIIRSNNTPYQEYIDREYFEVKEKPIKMGDASINYAQTYVTAKGVDYISKVIKTA